MTEEKVVVKSKNKKRKNKKIGLLFSITGLTAVVLVVETYAWFIGTSVVTTSEFDIGVTIGPALALSLDGENWETDTLNITKEGILGTATATDGSNAYTGNTNAWPGEFGLIPISTNGDVDPDSDRLKLFGKTSISATAGGYRLLSTRIDNYSSDGGGLVAEQDGYIAFDLFIKNGEGADYLPTFNSLDDESIYLITDSEVTVEAEGSTPDYGLANSVRVAFMQVGRVKSTSDPSDVISISCDSDEVPTASGGTKPDYDGINTGLCTDVKTTIWEPNDDLHDTMLIQYFSDVCRTKTVTTGETPEITYGTTACEALTATDGAVDTYVVTEDILSSDNVDVYDGINGYDIDEISDYKLKKSVTFTDTMKDLEAAERPEFFRLAPNSVTKIRVYIYLEGQDVDNYDLASLGQQVSIKFGFTKDRLDMNTKYSAGS